MADLLKFIKIFKNVTLDDIIIKHLIMNGVDSSEKLRDLVSQDSSIGNNITWGLRNTMHDYERGALDLNKVPSVENMKK